MNTKPLCGKWTYGLLVIPVLSAILALAYHDFAFKAGVAGSGIVLLGIVYRKDLGIRKDIWAIVAAFLFSIAGDWFLSNRHGDTTRFIAGIALFFVAHVGYLSYAFMNGRLNRTLTVILLAGYLIFFGLILYPSIDDKPLLFAVFVYILISCISLGAAGGIKAAPMVKWVYFFGISMVVFSDTIIAFREFTAYDQLSWLILPTYYLAQISVTLSLMIRRIKR